ncbi:MAG: Hpt domain-containing protein [Thermoanaerobaculia bacterium]
MSGPDDQLNTETSPLDGETLDSLRELGGDSFLGELAVIFLDDAPAQLAAIENALAAGDSDRLASSAHALKSSAGNMGAKRLNTILSEIEGAGRRGELEGVPAHVVAMNAEWVRVARALEVFRQG